MSTKDLVFHKISEILEIPKENITEEMEIVNIVQSSLTYFCLFLELEKITQKKLSFIDISNISTLKDVISFVEENKNHV